MWSRVQPGRYCTDGIMYLNLGFAITMKGASIHCQLASTAYAPSSGTKVLRKWVLCRKTPK